MSNISLGYTMFQEIGESMNDQVAALAPFTIKIKLVSPDVEWRTYPVFPQCCPSDVDLEGKV